MSDLSPGNIFAERYRIERRIASGGMGAVYEVVHVETNRRRALKVLHPNLVQSEQLRTRFRQEARVAAEIESEFIVDVSDAGIDQATEMPFLVMELLRGEDVRQRIKRAGPIPPEETIRILFEASLALDKTHQARIVHRDLKPDNLFLAEREHGLPRTKVLDFGIAKIVADGAMNGQTKESLGTPLYMAPEQFMMSANISAATDIFALGLISFTMLAGKPYWLQETLQAGAALAFAMHACKGPQESAVKRAAAYGITLPPAYDEWFFKATSFKPENRFQVATTAVVELAQVLGISLQMDAAPISIPAASGRGRTTLGSGVTVASVLSNSGSLLSNSGALLSNSGSGVLPPAPPPRAAMGSIPGTNTPLQPGATLAGSGLTNADVPPKKQPVKAIAGAAIGTVLVGGIVAYWVMSSSNAPTTSELGATPPPVASSAFVPQPEVKPLPESAPTVAPAASASTASSSGSVEKTPKNTAPATPGTSATTAATTTATTTATTRSTGTTKKTATPGLWNND